MRALLVPVLWCWSMSAGAQTVLQGDLRWRLADSPIALTEDAELAVEATLTIDPGVRVELGAGVSLIVRGTLVARGTADAPIVFTRQPGAADPACWNSIVFGDESVDALFADWDEYQSGSILEHCRFEYGTRALHLDRASPYVHRCTFENNRYEYDGEPAGGAAMRIAGGSAPRIVGCTFSGNVATSYGEGGALHIDQAEPILQGNSFLNNQSGYGGAIAAYGYHGPMVDNVFLDNNSAWEGGAMALVSSTPALIANAVTANRTLRDGAGVHVCTTCYPHANPLVMDNQIIDNVSDLDGGAGLGAAYLRVCSHNDLHGNRTAGQPADFAWFNENAAGYPDWVNRISVAHNWWGTTDPGAIAATIHDGRDDASVGTVTVEPVAEGPIAEARTRVALTTLKIRYADAAEPMPVYLTLYNPGPAREVLLLLRVRLADRPDWLPFDAAGLPGAWRENGGHRLTLPADAVWFGEVGRPAFVQPAGADEGWLLAALVDPTTGAPIAEAVLIGASYGEGAQ